LISLGLREGRLRRALTSVGVIGALLLGTRGVAGQSITDGSVFGTVVDSAGEPLSDARVVLTDSRTGVFQTVTTGLRGRFTFHLLQPGDYDLLAEKLGYQPVRYVELPVRPGQVLSRTLQLDEAEMPVAQVDTLFFRRASAEASRVGVGQWISNFGLRGTPGEGRTLSDVGRFAGFSTNNLESEGLPRWLSGFRVDGVQYRGARPPAIAFESAGVPALAMSAFRDAELVTNGVDVEMTGFAGSTLNAFSQRGTREMALGVFGDWTGAPVSGSKFFDPQDLTYSSWRGGAILSGPIVRDTASFVIGAEAQLTDTPYPRAWVDASLDDSLLAVSDSFGVDLSAYTQSRLVRTKMVSVFGRFDWQIRNHSFRLRGSAGSVRESDSDLNPTNIASIGSKYEGMDGQVTAALTSVFSPAFMSELRVGFEGNDRKYGSTSPTGTNLTAGGIAAGSDARLPMESKYSAVRGSATLHFPLGFNHIKAGVGGWWGAYTQTNAFASAGGYSFGGIDQFSRTDGAFRQSVGAFPSDKFNSWQVNAFVQGQWAAAPGLTLTGGFRYQFENIPINDIKPNADWFALTGIANNGATLDSVGNPVAAKDGFSRFYPRFGLTWRLGANQEWVVRAGAGLYRNEIDPPVMAEAITLDGDILARRGLGVLGSWPDVPDSSAAPVEGQLLSMLGPQWETPLSARLSLGLMRSLDARSVLHVAGEYRHTDFLSRRHDINRLSTPLAVDQYGRSIWGELQQRGSQLAVVPGSNRRFTDFDMVSSLDVDGYSDYWAVVVGLERQISRAWRASVQYTISGTRDNWLGARGGGPDRELTPFPDSLNTQQWEDGISDFDRPDRLVIATEIRLGKLPVALAGFYRYETGAPFTPGFRGGVDANGDGSGWNDVAYVDDEVPGISDLVSRWVCLRGQVGRFAERNSCRQPAVNRLDLRLAIRLFQRSSLPTEIVVDGINLFESDVGVPDNALYLVDPNGQLATSPAGVVTVPLVANSNFGQLLVRRTNGRFVRVGFRINY